MVELKQLLNECSLRVRSYTNERALLIRLIAAMRACALVALRFTRRLTYTESQLRWSLFEERELREAVSDIGNDEGLAREYLATRLAKHGGRQPVQAGDHSVRVAEAQRALRRGRKQLDEMGRLPELEELDEVTMSLEEGAVFVGQEVRVRSSQLGALIFEITECQDANCEARLMTVDQFPYPVVQYANRLPCCVACKTLVNRCDVLKDDIAALTGGQIVMQRVDMARRPGRPRRRK